MRDLLNDLEAGKYLSDPDPIRRAQSQMKTQLPKRFYKDVSVAPAEGGFAVHLDGKPVRTPGKIAAGAAHREGSRARRRRVRRAGRNDRSRRPCRSTGSSTRRSTASRATRRRCSRTYCRFASSDLLCYRADSPAGLVERQAEAWDPVIDWARSALGARLVLAEGVIHVEQPREAIAAIGVHLCAAGRAAAARRAACDDQPDRIGAAGAGRRLRRARRRDGLGGRACRRGLPGRAMGPGFRGDGPRAPTASAT